MNNQICIWCKYGQKEGDRIQKETQIALMDSRTCSKCKREGLSSTFMADK